MAKNLEKGCCILFVVDIIVLAYAHCADTRGWSQDIR